FNGVVATFSDNLAGTSASAYVAAVAWSDGITTTGTIVKNADGTFSVKTSRTFSGAGVVVATASVGTADGLFFSTTNLSATVTNKNDKCPGPKDKDFKNLDLLVKHWLDNWRMRVRHVHVSHVNIKCHHG